MMIGKRGASLCCCVLRGKLCADCLMIDGLVAQCGERLSSLWKRDEGGTGLYPPPTLHVSINSVYIILCFWLFNLYLILLARLNFNLFINRHCWIFIYWITLKKLPNMQLYLLIKL